MAIHDESYSTASFFENGSATAEGGIEERYFADSKRPSRPPADKPAHYKVICISLYTQDLARLDDMVDTLKGRGFTKASRSALIRAALEQVDLAKVPRGI
jgi:hypothetical protein